MSLQFGGDILHIKPESNWGMTFNQLTSQFKTEWKFIVRSTPFILLALIGFLVWFFTALSRSSYESATEGL